MLVIAKSRAGVEVLSGTNFNIHFVDTEIRLRLGTEGRWPKGKANAQINLAFRSACTNFSPCYASTEVRLRLGKMQTSLLFLSACTNFVSSNMVRNL